MKKNSKKEAVKREKKMSNSTSVILLQIVLLILTLTFGTLIFSLFSIPLCFIVLLLTRLLYKYDYYCPNCGAKINKTTDNCFSCKTKLK